MKCIKRDGVVQRVNNDLASKRVNEGWVFCPKSEWKQKEIFSVDLGNMTKEETEKELRKIVKQTNKKKENK